MKSNFSEWQYQIFWVIIPAFLVLSRLGRHAAIDIQMHDTYYVVSPFHIGQLLSFKFFIFGLTYWLLRKTQLLNVLTRTHILLTILCTITLLLYLYFRKLLNYNFDAYSISKSFVSITLLVYIFAQILFIGNIIFSLSRKKL